MIKGSGEFPSVRQGPSKKTSNRSRKGTGSYNQADHSRIRIE